jgi:TPR repeat protein
MVYLYGDLGQSQNMKAGLQYLKRAASFATEAAPMAPYVLGLILSRDYSNQLNIPDDIAFPDDGEALEWFRKSAQLGYGPANYKLGYCYEYGSLGCPIDPFLSIQHYERAVLGSDGNGEAEMALSGWYLSGADNCFAADDRLAFHYASLAAEKNLPKAQYAMGYYHEVGISVPIDLEKAMEFYKRAAENGNKDAKKRLEEQTAKFTPLGHKNSIKRMKNGRKGGPKDGSCTIM